MVDDSPADRRFFEVLPRETYGTELEFFGEGTASVGLAACPTRHPDCVLLDYKLPDLTGIEFLKRLRAWKSPDFPEYARVTRTGLSIGQVGAAALKGGAHDYLAKSPMTAQALSLEIEKATQEVTLLRTLKAERDRLACSLAEKELSLLPLQARGFDNEDFVRALRETHSRLESMALMHEQLSRCEGLRDVDMSKHAVILIGNLLHSYGVEPSRISWQITPRSLGIDQAVPAGRILNELISNALRHAFPDGRCGSIGIEGFLESGEVVLADRGEGIGIPQTPRPSAQKSIGLEIVAVLTRPLKGSLELDRASNTTFRPSYPKEQRIDEIHSAIHGAAKHGATQHGPVLRVAQGAGGGR